MNNLAEIEEAVYKLKEPDRKEMVFGAIRESFKDSLYLVSTELSGHKDVRLETHGNMIKCLEAPTKRKIIVEPRGTFKSSVGVVDYSIFRIINNWNIRILIDSEVYTNSTTYLREIKGILASDRFARIFGPTMTRTWNEGELIVAQRTKNLKEATITCGAVGTTKVGQHYDLILGDDYNGKKNSFSPEQRLKVIDHVKYNQAILDPDGTYGFIATRWHDDDVIGWLIKNELGINNFRSKIDLKGLHQEDGVFYA